MPGRLTLRRLPKTLVEDPRGGPPLPRTTKKNVEVAAALCGRPESSSYPLAPQTLKDRPVSWVRPKRSEVEHSLSDIFEVILLYAVGIKKRS